LFNSCRQGFKRKTELKKITEVKKALLIRNSWSKSRGDGGYGWLPYDYVLTDLALDYWPLPGMQRIDTGNFGLQAGLGSRVNIRSCELVARHFSRQERAADSPAISTGLMIARVNTAPASGILISPVRRAVSTAISSPRRKSRALSLKNFDLITIGF